MTQNTGTRRASYPSCYWPKSTLTSGNPDLTTAESSSVKPAKQQPFSLLLSWDSFLSRCSIDSQNIYELKRLYRRKVLLLPCINWWSGPYRWDILGTTQAPPSLLLPFLKSIFMFTACYWIWSPVFSKFSYLFFANIQNFIKAIPGDPSSCGKKMQFRSQNGGW